MYSLAMLGAHGVFMLETLTVQLAHSLGNCVHFQAVFQACTFTVSKSGNLLHTQVNKTVHKLCT